MQEKLHEKFQEKFKNMNKETREEDLLLFLDNRMLGKFDREAFKEITHRIRNENKPITPYNFVNTYDLAHKVLTNKNEKAKTGQQDLITMQKNLQNVQKIMKLNIDNINIERIIDNTNYLKFEIDNNFKTTIYPNDDSDLVSIFVPDKVLSYKKNMKVSLLNHYGKNLDMKEVPISMFQNEYHKVIFKDNTEISFENIAMDSNKTELGRYFKEKNAECRGLFNFTEKERDILEEPFPDIYKGGKGVKKNVNNSCSCILIITIILTALMTLITLVLNYSRCSFIDIFVGMAFFGNVYVWRIFNIFLALRLIGILSISIIIDLVWEIMRLVHYTENYNSDMKFIRILGLVFSFINILIKIILSILYFKLSREKQDEGYLAIEDENSMYEVDEKDYLVNLRTVSPIKSNNNILEN